MAKKTKNQMAYDLINQKYGLGGNQKYASSAITVTNNNKGNQSDKGSQNNKGKQSNSASSTTTNKSVETKPQSSFERINQKYGLSGTSTPTKKLSDFNGETKNAYLDIAFVAFADNAEAIENGSYIEDYNSFYNQL